MLTIGKLDAAVRQLRTAIRLWFADGDPVAIHTLASVAHELIHTIFRRKGHRDLLFDSDLVRDEFRTEWSKSIVKHYNFFKHARSDPDSLIKFDPEINTWLLFILVNALNRMDVPESVEEMSFSRWIVVHHPEVLNEVAKDMIPDSMREQIIAMGKSKFFAAFEEYWLSQKS